MRFLVDECTGPVVAQWLRSQGHDVFSVYDEARGCDDDAVLQRAWDEDRILITNDKDFGELVYQDGRPHKGIILIRLAKLDPANQIAALERVLTENTEKLPGQFTVVTEATIRTG